MIHATETMLGGRYRLTDRIARGGMGEVWRAADALLGRVVAVKLLREDLAVDPGFLGRFRAEARNTAALSHPGIAAVHDYGEQNGYAYLVMELIPGEPLSWILSREGALDPDRGLRYVGQAALALQAAHDAGVVHRDIKPPNIIITQGDQVKITDFGIARAVGDQSLTGTGTVMGTAEYLSPEQASGGDASPASDLYALGIVLYESLAGRRPFQGSNPVTIAMAQVSETPPALPASVPAHVSELVFRLLAKDPRQRPSSAGMLAREIAHLRSILESADITADAESRDRPATAATPDREDPHPNRVDTANASAPAEAVRHAVPAVGAAVSDGRNPPAGSLDVVDPAGKHRRRAEASSGEAHADRFEAGNHSSRHGRGQPGSRDRHTSQVEERPSPSDRLGEPAEPARFARASILDGLAARPTGRRRAPRRGDIEVSRLLGRLGRKNRQIVPVLATAIALITVITSVSLTRGSDSSDGVTVPAVTGEHVTAATSDLEAAGLSPLVVRSASATVDPDIVIRQAPSPGQTVDKGSVVEILVSAGRLGAFGDPADRSPRSATLAAQTIGFRVESDTDNSRTSIPGTVSWSRHRPTWSAHPSMNLPSTASRTQHRRSNETAWDDEQTTNSRGRA